MKAHGVVDAIVTRGWRAAISRLMIVSASKSQREPNSQKAVHRPIPTSSPSQRGRTASFSATGPFCLEAEHAEQRILREDGGNARARGTAAVSAPGPFPRGAHHAESFVAFLLSVCMESHVCQVRP